MKIIPPTRADIAQIDRAIKSFRPATGCVDYEGNFKPTIAGSLWMMINTDAAGMSALWRHAGINTDSESAYTNMQAAKLHTITLTFWKVRKSLFRSGWVGNVSLDFDNSRVFIGSVAGRTQSQMWSHYRGFLKLDGQLYDGTELAHQAC